METNYIFFLRNFAAKSGCLFLFLILLTSNFGGNILNAQVSAYSFSQTNGAYSSINGATILGTATANTGAIPSLDTASFPVTIPFSFFFNGQNYTDFNMSTNGYITFGTGLATGSTPISGTTTYDGAISAWGRDINAVFDIVGKTGNMSYAIEGTAPNRVAVMQWENFRPTYTTTATSAYVFSFQIRLAETTNVISTVYSDGSYLIGSTAYSATNTQIGLRGATNADFNNRTNPSTVAFTSSTAGTANSNGQSFSTTASPAGMPTPGLTYTWTPPTCIFPTNITISNISSTSASVNWTASVSAPTNGYDIFVSTSNTPPTAASTPTLTGVTGTSFVLTGLTPSTQYYVWVRSNCGVGDFSNWSNLKLFNSACQPPAITGTTGSTICPNSTATLTATADAGATIHWYDAGGTEVATGPNFTTPSLSSTTTYYTSASVGTSNVPVGKTTYSAGPSSGAGTTNFGLVFDVFSPCILSSLTIYPVSPSGAAGIVIIDVIDENGNILNTHTENVVGAPVGAPVAHIVNVNFALIPGTNYKLRHSSHAGISGYCLTLLLLHREETMDILLIWQEY